MRVLFISRPTIFSVPGGDTVQMEFTAKELTKKGVIVDLLTSLEKVNYEDYDLIHFFNLTRPSAILAHTTKSKLPYVVSTIFVQYDFYKVLAPWSKMGIISRVFGLDGVEYFKTVVKHFLRKEKLDYLPFIWKGQRNSIKKVLKAASAILPNSNSEESRVINAYGVKVNSHIVPNGIDFEKFKLNQSVDKIDNQLICVGQIEPRKNQLNLIKAIKDLDVTLKIIGNPAPNHTEYYEQCKKEASSKVEFIKRVEQEELVIHYQSAAIHILPSWFETTGLSSLEAAYLGCKIIVSPNGDTQDYFEDFANYCEPGSVSSIAHSIVNALQRDYSDELRNLIIEKYNWERTADLTINCYKETLEGE